MPELSVTLLKATDLPAADGFLQGNASDPFVTLELGGDCQRSSCVSRNLNPVWQPAETFVFEVDKDVDHAKLFVRVVDNDTFKPDDLLGEAVVPLAELLKDANRSVAKTVTLEVPPEVGGSEKTNSLLFLELCLTLEDAGHATLSIWENEDWKEGKWVPAHSAEWRHWSTFDRQVSSDNFEQVAPQVPDGLEGKGWAYATIKGDDHGWVYASSFTGPWSAAPGTTSYARRRLWQNHCRPAVACE